MRTKIALIICAVLLFAVSLVFPPWLFRLGDFNRTEFAGYRFFASESPILPSDEIKESSRFTDGPGGAYIKEWKDENVKLWVAEVDTGRLVLQAVLIATCLAGALLTQMMWTTEKR